MLIRFIFVDDGAIHLHSQFPIFGPKNINLFNRLLIIGGVVSRFLLQSVLEVKVQSQSTRRLAISRSSDILTALSWSVHHSVRFTGIPDYLSQFSPRTLII